MLYCSKINTSLNDYYIWFTDNSLLHLSEQEHTSYVESLIPIYGVPVNSSTHSFAANVEQQISEYLSRERKDFTIPYTLHVSDFCKKVLNSLAENIAYGKVVSYLGLSLLCRSGSARAMGTAMGKNPIPFIIPSHRVISSSGKVTGCTSAGRDKRQFLIDLEKQNTIT